MNHFPASAVWFPLIDLLSISIIPPNCEQISQTVFFPHATRGIPLMSAMFRPHHVKSLANAPSLPDFSVQPLCHHLFRFKRSIKSFWTYFLTFGISHVMSHVQHCTASVEEFSSSPPLVMSQFLQ